jgi:hypothetical protein
MHAIKALHRGEATQDQQLRFVAWLVKATGVSENPYRAESARDTDFACGKKFVADQYFSIVKMPVPRE